MDEQNQIAGPEEEETSNAELMLYYIENPSAWVKDFTGKSFDEWQDEGINELFSKGFLSVRSGHGVGKTFFIALLVLYFLFTRPNSIVLCTSPSKEQLFDALWAYLGEMIRENPILSSFFTWTKDKVYVTAQPEKWFAVARTAEVKKSKTSLSLATVEGLQGKHAEHILVIIDEASGVEEAVFSTLDGAMTTEDAYYVMTGNPTNNSGRFFDSHHGNSDMYHTIHVDAEKSARVSKKWIERMLKLYNGNREHPMYRIRVRGEFPLAQTNALYPLEDIKRAQRSTFSGGGIFRIGADIARYGICNTVICISESGTVFNDKNPDGIWGQKIHTFDYANHQDTMESTGKIVRHSDDCEPLKISIDEPGVGGGVFDRLKELGFKNIVPVNGGKTANNPKDYMNLRAEMHWNLHNLLITGALVLPANSTTFQAQATPMTYTVTSTGKIKIQTKEEMLELGLKSPDDVDAVVLSIGDVTPCEVKKPTQARFGTVACLQR